MSDDVIYEGDIEEDEFLVKDDGKVVKTETTDNGDNWSASLGRYTDWAFEFKQNDKGDWVWEWNGQTDLSTLAKDTFEMMTDYWSGND